MLSSLFCAKKILKDSNKIIISYGDIIYEPKIIMKLLRSKSNINVVVDKKWEKLWSVRFKKPIKDAESLKTDNKNNIIDIGLRVKNKNQIQGQFVGLILLNKKGIKTLINLGEQL